MPVAVDERQIFFENFPHGPLSMSRRIYRFSEMLNEYFLTGDFKIEAQKRMFPRHRLVNITKGLAEIPEGYTPLGRRSQDVSLN